MGGKAFSKCKPPLSTPRLPPSLYFRLRNSYIHRLQQLFEHVDSPIEAPGKFDYGDIDILVASPIPCKLKPLSESIPKDSQYYRDDPSRKAIFALLRPHKIIRNSKATSLAIPHPALPSAFVQLDIHVLSTFKAWKWNLFQYAHGDLWIILGAIIRPFGLTATDRGFCVRDKDIEPMNKERSRVFLTGEPAQVLNLLGYKESEFWSPSSCGGAGLNPSAGDEPPPDLSMGCQESSEASASLKSTVADPVTPAPPSCPNPQSFHDINALFAFATRCRFFRKTIFTRPPTYEDSATQLKRKAKRDMYRLFVEEYIPSLPDSFPPPAQFPSEVNDPPSTPSGPVDTSSLNLSTPKALADTDEAVKSRERALERQCVFHEVLDRWGKREEWMEMRRKWDAEKDELGDKAVGRALKSALAREENECADAWIEVLKREKAVVKVKEEGLVTSSMEGE